QIPDMAEATRRKVLDMLIADKMLVQTFHAPFPALGHMEKDGQSCRFVPAPWSPAVRPARNLIQECKAALWGGLLNGSRSWIRIELCAVPRNLGFRRILEDIRELLPH